MLNPICEILEDAQRRKYGVVAFNVFNFESVYWAICAAEEEKMPVTLQFYPGFDVHIPTAAITEMIRHFACKTKIPVALHMDHSFDFDVTMSNIKYFPSVMIDGSKLPFEENVALTQKVVKIAHAMGIEVEAELGHVGSGMNESDMSSENFTQPNQAADFVERTGCDLLAVSIGNAHGVYIKTPAIAFEHLAKIREKVAVPLVMHGGSGIPDEQLARCVVGGMSKFNIFTEYVMKMGEILRAKPANPHFYECIVETKAPIVEFMRHKIKTLNPNGISVI